MDSEVCMCGDKKLFGWGMELEWEWMGFRGSGLFYASFVSWILSSTWSFVTLRVLCIREPTYG